MHIQQPRLSGAWPAYWWWCTPCILALRNSIGVRCNVYAVVRVLATVGGTDDNGWTRCSCADGTSMALSQLGMMPRCFDEELILSCPSTGNWLSTIAFRSERSLQLVHWTYGYSEVYYGNCYYAVVRGSRVQFMFSWKMRRNLFGQCTYFLTCSWLEWTFLILLWFASFSCLAAKGKLKPERDRNERVNEWMSNWIDFGSLLLSVKRHC